MTVLIMIIKDLIIFIAVIVNINLAATVINSA
jgi:hypothetical protein